MRLKRGQTLSQHQQIADALMARDKEGLSSMLLEEVVQVWVELLQSNLGMW